MLVGVGLGNQIVYERANTMTQHTDKIEDALDAVIERLHIEKDEMGYYKTTEGVKSRQELRDYIQAILMEHGVAIIEDNFH